MKTATKTKIINWISKKLKYHAPDKFHAYLDRKEYEVIPVKKTITGNKQGFPIVGRVNMITELVRFLMDNDLVKFETIELPVTHTMENMQLTAEILILKRLK